MFKKILIANRGEIACRVMRTAKNMGVRSVAVHSDADAGSKHVAMADEAIRLGPAEAAQSYLAIDRIIDACRATGAEAVHPGYGFLAENAAFVDAVTVAGLVFIGPPASAIRAMGFKDNAKTLMAAAGVPVVPGYHGNNQDLAFLAAQADTIGYPVLIKARAGGGGKGLRRVETPAGFEAALAGARREAEASFGDGQCIIEKFVGRARHIEVQVFGDQHGNIVHLFERDCSLQRRHQKVIEEAPAPNMPDGMRADVGAIAVRAAQAISYTNAGTVEFIADISAGLRRDRFYFMEMNTRLQVEHPVTEFITGQDLVEWQLRVAAGETLPAGQADLTVNGWAFEARIYAEDPAKGFLPAIGRLDHLSFPAERGGVRVDAGVRAGDEITPYYDPMIAKLIVHGPTREAARKKLSAALADCHVAGATTNLSFLSALSAQPDFARGDVDTGLIERHLSALVAEADVPREALGLAALAALDLVTPRQGADPWDRLAGWRMWGDARHHVQLEYGDERFEVDVMARDRAAYDIGIAGSVDAFKLLGEDGARVRFEYGRQTRVAGMVGDGHGVTIFLDGRTFSFGLPDRLADDDDGDVGGDLIVSPLPGLVKLVSAKPGDAVIAGEPLIVIEAMKMEHGMTAPRDGVIDQVMVSEGTQVEDGTVLIALRPEDPPA